MYLQYLHLKQFRNYYDQEVKFTTAKTILVGDNAQGKSNLLEAVELLSTLKSHRVIKDQDLILNSQDTGQISAVLERRNGTTNLALTLRRQGGRTVNMNGENLRRHLDFLSVLNVVEFSSLDLDLVRGSPENRRHWLDRLLIQLEPVYANIAQEYQKILRQRNACIKKLRKKSETFDHQQVNQLMNSPELAVWDSQLVTTGTRLIRRRQRVLNRLIPLAQKWHSAISNSQEILQITYLDNLGLSQHSENSQNIIDTDNLKEIQDYFLEQIHEKTVAEYYQGSSLVGPHRDDILFTINETPARQYGSQGQQRTLVLALKLAELELIEQVVQEPPLLLLDDVLAELDLRRQNQLLEVISDRFQTLITTTHLSAFATPWLQNTQILTVQSGQINSFFDF